MGDAPDWNSLRQRLAGKWQIPTLLLSFVCLATAFYSLRPPPSAIDLTEAESYLATLVSGEMYDRALELGEAVLARDETYSERELAPIHLQVARARHGEAERLGVRSPSVGRRIIQDYRHAVDHGVRLDPRDYVRLGQANEWAGHYEKAAASYEQAVAQGVDDALHLRRRIIELERDHHLVDAATLSEHLTAFLDVIPKHRLDLMLWAIEEQLFALEAQGRIEDATTLLVRYADRFRQSDLRDRFAFLEALLLYQSGHYDEAEVHARTILNQASRQDEVHAMAAWLLGRVVMYDDGPKRPEEAITFFNEVIGIAPHTPYGVASYVGKAEALTLLERHEAAIDAYRVALQLLPTLRDHRLVNREVIRTSLGVASERALRAGAVRRALGYGALAARLIDEADVEQSTLILERLAAIQMRLADELSEQLQAPGADSTDHQSTAALQAEVRSLRSAAADTFARIAQLNVLNERRAADASWQAAEAAALAGETRRAIRMFHAYVQERPGDPRVPRALLRVGQLRKQVGDIDGAIAAFQECYRRFPRTLDGARALIPLAECYLAKTPSDIEMAEKTLSIIIEESDVFTPKAPEFADALFLLGEAQSRGGDDEQAIATFEEVVARYPDDPRVLRGRFLLADAYRRSALAIKASAASARSAAESERLRQAYRDRFVAARRQFRALIDELGRRNADSLTALERVYLRQALLYEADCYFETQAYRQALKLYEEAAGVYRDHPSALAAYVQIIHCHVFLGELREARAALSRALVVVDSMPEHVFTESISPETREDWKRYFTWLGASELF